MTSNDLLPADAGFVERVDFRPAIFQQIRDLEYHDIIPELIQNEIDAGSDHTIISFEEARMVCLGRGEPIDSHGWDRLSYFLGAGDKAPRKRNSIGVKNHGLKACFRLGDDIFIRSGGKFTQQTLYMDGPENSPRPAALKAPIDDPSSPKKGVQIEVPYRVNTLATDVGEPFVLEAAEALRIEELFRRAVHEIPSRFIGVVRPGDRNSYTVEVKHHSLGAVKFEFVATRAQRKSKDTWFLRHCKVTGTAAEGLLDLRERAVTRSIPRPGGSDRDVFPLFQDKSRVVIEVAWAELRDRILPAENSGLLRYPIAYSDISDASRSGLGVHYSAPFISNTERHGAIVEDPWNSGLISACDELLADSLRELIPKWTRT